jgi:hypothetical protein
MYSVSRSCLFAAIPLALGACGGPETGDEAAETGDATAAEMPATPYKPVATVADLMRSVVSLSAERYWGAVSVVVDADGEHENMPQTDLEWLELWGDAMTLAESGNLLMMPPRAPDQDEWIRLSTELVDVGARAAQLALDRDFEGVLAVGEDIYNVCSECHEIYVPTLPDL